MKGKKQKIHMFLNENRKKGLLLGYIRTAVTAANPGKCPCC